MRTLSILLFVVCINALNAQMVFPDEVTISGPEETIFDWTTDQCELEDIPDNEARFFRDADGNIQMIASHYNSFRMIGPDFDNLTRDCDNGYIFESDLNSNIGEHDDHEWMHTVFTYDGATIYAYLHNEWHGHNYGCNGDYLSCWYNSITFATSTDSGKTYTHAPSPDHLALAPPYEFENGDGPGGYFKPSNIVYNDRDGFYYMLFQIETIGAQERGTGIVRTTTPEDPSSWLGWDGTGFTVNFVDIYNETVNMPTQHRVEPLDIFMQGSLSWNTYFEKWMVVGPGVLNDTWGFYYRISDDLLNWSAPVLILESNVWTNVDADTNVDRTLYGSLIDHADTSRNFMYTGRDCHLYYTRWHPGSLYDRDLVRVPVQFNKLEVDGWTVNSTAFAYDNNPGDGVCESTAGGCTVLAALDEANGRPQTHHDSLLTIEFNLPSGGVIELDGPAGGVLHPTVFDGTTMAGYSANTSDWFEPNNAAYSVIIDLNGHEGFEFNAKHSGIRGIQLREAGIHMRADSCFVEGCFIQTDGENAYTSTDYGVYIYSVDGTRIGGESPEQQNLICKGIFANEATHTLITNTKVDTDRDGSTMLINEGGAAVTFSGGSDNEVNTIVANGGYNRAIDLSGCEDVLIDNCIIGLAPDFSAGVGSYNSGIFFGSGAQMNDVTDCYIGASSCGVAHILLEGGAKKNTVKGCSINTDLNGDPIDTGDESGLAGIYVGENASSNTFGGDQPAEGNSITNVPLAGIIVSSNGGSGNAFRGNEIWNNGGLGIDLNFDQMVAENDSEDADGGVNIGMNHPVIQTVTSSNGEVTITGKIFAEPNKTFAIDLFAGEECDESGYGEGKYYIASISVQTGTSGDANFDYTYTAEAEHQVFSATLTDIASANTGEFGPCLALAAHEPDLSYSPSSIEKTITALNSDTETLYLQNIGLVELEYAIFTDQDWITLSSNQGTLQAGESAEIIITMDATTLEVGFHGGNVFVDSNDPDTPEVEIPVLVESVLGGTLELSETEVTIENPNANEMYSLTLTNNGSEQITWGHELEPAQAWVTQVLPSGGTISPDGGSTVVSVHFQTQNLDPGEHTSYVNFNSNASNASTITVNFTLIIPEDDNDNNNGGGGGGVIAVAPSSIQFFLPQNGNGDQQLQISNNGNQNINWSWDDSESAAWLSPGQPGQGNIQPGGMNGSFVSANASGLAQGQYTSQITINSNAGNTPSLVIPVTLNVTGEVNEGDPDGPIPQVTPESLEITLPPDITENIEIELFNAGDENLTWSGSAPVMVGWISPGMPNAGNVQPGMINVANVQINTEGMSAGNYQSEFVLNTNATPSNVIIPVTLIIDEDAEGGDPEGPVPHVNPEILEISLNVNQNVSQSIDIQNIGTQPLAWSSGTPIDDTWISAGMPNAGNVQPGMITTTLVQLNTNGLTPGTYESEFVLNTNATPSNVVIPVSLTVMDDNEEEEEDPVANVMTTQTTFCQGEEFEVLWNIPEGNFDAGNNFEVQLSNETGSFAMPTVIGNFTANQGNGNMMFTLPTNLVEGDQYRIRLVSSSPQIIGEPSGDPLTIYPMMEVDAGSYPVICTNSSMFALNAGSPSGGNYEGDYVSNNHFNAVAAGEGTHEITYTAVSPEGCSFTATTQIEVNSEPTVALIEAGPFCTNSVGVELSAMPEGGQWEGTGISDNTFFPELAGEGEHTLHFSFESFDGCSVEGEMTVSVYALPEVSMSLAEPVCAGNGIAPLPQASPSGGSYWGEFITENGFDSDQATPGVYTVNYSYTSDEGCVNTAAAEIAVNPSPVPLIDFPATFCDNEEDYFLDPNPVGGIFEGIGVTDGYFQPSSLSPGVYEIMYFTVNQFGCMGTVSGSTQVVEAPEIELTLPTYICQQDMDVEMDFGSPEGGQYTYDGVIIDELDPSNLEIGYHEISYYYVGTNGCESVTTGGFLIEEVPNTPVVNFDGTSLEVFNTNEYVLQWYHNGMPISIDTDAFIPVESGEYYATYNNGFCTSETSNVVDVTITGIEEMNAAGLSVYPVPFNDKLVIEAFEVWGNDPVIRMYDANARLVREWSADQITMLNGKYIIQNGLSLLPKGNYYLILDLPGQSLRSIVTR